MFLGVVQTYKIPVQHIGEDIPVDHPEIAIQEGLECNLGARSGILRRVLRTGASDLES